MLVEAMNAHFKVGPLVVTNKGGAARGGASLTPLGAEVLQAFRDMQQATDKAVASTLKRLQRKVQA